MKKLFKGINTDCLPNDQPDGSWRDAVNIVINKKVDSVSNEDGVDDVTPISINPSTKNYPLKPNIGGITIGDEKILFFGTTNPIDSEIGRIKSDGLYYPIVKDSILNFNQNHPIQATYDNKFNNNIVIGWTDNFNKIRVLNIDCIPFTTNLDGTIPSGEQAKANVLLSLFPDYSTPTIARRNMEVIEGAGQLLTGVYFPFISYGFEDGSFTSYSKIYNGITVYQDDKNSGPNQVGGCEGGLSTNKYIQIKLNNVDINFKFLKIGYLYLKNDITLAYEVKTLTISGTDLDITILGNESSIIEININDVIIPQAIYEKAKTITNFQKNLEIGHLTEPDAIEFQQKANLIDIKWYRAFNEDDVPESTLTLDNYFLVNYANDVEGSVTLKPAYKNETTVFFDKSFKSGEVVALYIGLKLKNGKYQIFHIPGRDVLVGDRIILNPTPTGSDINDLDNGNPIYNYQIFDTSTVDVGSYFTGKMGFWENENELYPEDPNNPGSVHPDFANIPGVNFANRKVRHHVFPDMKKLVDNFQSFFAAPGSPDFLLSGASTAYSETRLINAVSPSNANYYYPYFQNLGGTSGTSSFNYTSILGVPNKAKFDAFAVSGNFNMKLSFNQDLSKSRVGNTVFVPAGDWAINISVFKNSNLYTSYNLTVNSSKILDTSNLPGQNIEINVNVAPGDIIEMIYEIYTSQGTASFINPFTYNYLFASLMVTLGDPYLLYSKPLGIKVSNVNIPANILPFVDSWEIFYAKRTNESVRVIAQDMIKQERFHNFDLLYSKLSIKPSYLKPLLSYTPTIPGQLVNIAQEMSIAIVTEDPFPTNTIESVSKWLYVGENTTSPVNNSNKATSIFPIAGHGQTSVSYLQTNYGDTNTLMDFCVYRRNVYSKFQEQELLSTGYNVKIAASGIQPVKVIFGGDIFICEFGFKDGLDSSDNYNLMCEFVNNVSLRSEDKVNGFTYFPKSNTPTASWYGYNKDFNCLNIYNSGDIFYPIKPCLDNINYFPYRVAQSNKEGSESKKLNWRVFKINSYYDVPKNKGVIWNILASDRTLYIHTEFTLFIAQIRDRLATTEGEVFLGISDIFDRPPQEVIASNEGYAGTQSQFACIVCKLGYCFIDRKAGKVFIFKEGVGLREISEQGLYNFFIEHSQTFLEDIDNPFISKGYMMAYDKQYNRLILSKTDTETIDTGYKFCLSYCPDLDNGKGGWTSYHSYNPNLLLSTRDELFAIDNTQFKIFRHNSDINKGKYYDGVTRFSSIDFVENQGSEVTKRFDNIKWISRVEKNLVNYSQETFTHLLVYNDTQCSGIIDLALDSTLWFSNSERNREGTWNFNNFRDLIKNVSLPFLNNKNALISSNIDANKLWFEQSKFISKYIVFRMIYDNSGQKDLHLTLIGVNFIKSDS